MGTITDMTGHGKPHFRINFETTKIVFRDMRVLFCERYLQEFKIHCNIVFTHSYHNSYSYFGLNIAIIRIIFVKNAQGFMFNRFAVAVGRLFENAPVKL